MKFEYLNDEDWQQFLFWAAEEGWNVPFQEQLLFQHQWRPYFFVLRVSEQAVGFVSAVAYKASGWIGNLLVGPGFRGRGYGAALFDYAHEFLHQAKLSRIWLTASAAGRPLYTRRGFISVDRVERWVGAGEGRQEFLGGGDFSRLITLDTDCWGESRAPLLLALADQAELCAAGQSLALLQPSADSWQLGPWLSRARSSRENRLLLTQALQKTTAGKKLIVDVLVSSEMQLVLRSAGFKRAGSNELMCSSTQPVKLAGVIALASLGSIG